MLSDVAESMLGPEVVHNPFSPGFGQPPTHLVGREDILGPLGAGLRAGPHDEAYTSVLVGPRGSGKTALLTEIGERAAEDGWIVLPVDASTSDLHGRIRQAAAYARATHEGAEAAAPGAKASNAVTGFRLGPLGAQWQGTQEAVEEWNTRYVLTALAEHARSAGTSVLLSIDELQGGDREELRRLVSDIQHVTTREQRPLAFVGSALPEVHYTLFRDPKLSFFRRCADFSLRPLNGADAAIGLRRTALAAGGDFEPAALEAAVEACGPLPYKMQLIGHHAWAMSGAPERAVDMLAVGSALEVAESRFSERVVLPAWNGLPERCRKYLAALSALGGIADRPALGSHFGSGIQGLSDAEQRLKLEGHIEEAGEMLRLTAAMPAEAVDRYSTGDALYGAHLSSDGALAPLVRARCNEYMPLARALCQLPRGHNGAHRSGRPRR